MIKVNNAGHLTFIL